MTNIEMHKAFGLTLSILKKNVEKTGSLSAREWFVAGWKSCAAHLAQQPVATVDDRNYAMNSEPERKRFEEYIRERQPGASFVFHRRPNGPYIDDFTEYQWLAWDYRASLKSQPNTSRDEKLFKFYDWLEDECAIRLDIFEDADSAFKLYAAFKASQKKGA